ncbi:MAG: hypoxanthine phosphoribosyltransferase [Dysgonamonadaceae bacterium]|nr:hypoxanthine phosphoribosyltransferase [Dysgonamonadaceae bacterium]
MSKNLVIEIKDRQFELFIKEETILNSINRISKQIRTDLHDKNPLFVCVLNGAFMFASDLMKQLDFPCEIAFIRLKSYQGTASVGVIREVHGLIEDVQNRNVVILEDIIDTGHTIEYLIQSTLAKQPESLRIATLLFKPEALQADIKADYVAMEIPNDFIVGYGLDYDGYGRNLKDIYKIKE